MTHRLNRSLDRVLTSRPRQAPLCLFPPRARPGRRHASKRATDSDPARGGNSGQAALERRKRHFLPVPPPSQLRSQITECRARSLRTTALLPQSKQPSRRPMRALTTGRLSRALLLRHGHVGFQTARWFKLLYDQPQRSVSVGTSASRPLSISPARRPPRCWNLGSPDHL